MRTLFDSIQNSLAHLYIRACGGRLWPDGMESASLERRPLCVLVMLLMAAPLLAGSLAIEFLLPSYLRFLILAWIVAVFFFMASVDRRAARILTPHLHPGSH